MDLAAYRRSKGLSQAEVADALELQSKASISMIESGLRKATIRIALQIEHLTEGAVLAPSLLSDQDAQLLREAIVRAGGKVPAEAEPA